VPLTHQGGATASSPPRNSAFSATTLAATPATTSTSTPHATHHAEELLVRFGGLPGILQARQEELCEIKGIGPSAAARLKAALECGRRLMTTVPEERLMVRSPADIAMALMAEMSHLEQEHFKVLTLDTRNRVLANTTLYIGCLDASHIRVGEVFREAVKRNAAALIIAHNHPSGDPTPSPEDVEVTRQIVKAGDLIDIELLDHLVIGQQRFISLRERGLGFN